MVTVSIPSKLTPLLGCRGQSGRNNGGFHLAFPTSTCISKYCSQTHIKWSHRAKGHGWEEVFKRMGSGIERGSLCVGLCMGEREKRRRLEKPLSASILLKADGVLSLAQGAYADPMTFFPGTRFYT